MLEAAKNNTFWKENKTLIAIILLGLALRLYGLNHGFPFIFHPDEPAVVRSATGIRFESNPGHFDWPHLHFYLNFFLYWVFIKFRGLLQILGLRSFLASTFPLLWRDPLVFYWLSRLFDAFLGAFTALPLYLAGKALYNKRTGILAALTITLIPFHVHASHFALIDVPTAFWISWALYFSAKIYKSAELKNYLLAGLFIGFAASTKYNGGLAALVVLVAHVLRLIEAKSKKISIQLLIASGFAALVGFIVGTPYSILDFDTFTRTDSPVGALWQFTNVGSVDFPARVTQFLRVMSVEFIGDFGYTFIAIFTLYLVYRLIRIPFAKFKGFDIRPCLVFIPGLIVLFYTAGFEKLRTHYFMTAYPFIALAVAIAVGKLSDHKAKLLQKLIYLAVFVPPLLFSINRSTILHRPDTRNELYNWLSQNVTILDYVYYGTSSLDEVMDKVPTENVDRFTDVTALSGQKGYIIHYGAEDGEKLFGSEYDKVLEISNEGRRGENIVVYAFDRTN